MNILKWLGYAALGLMMMFFLASIMFIPFTLLWNWIMPAVFGLCKISFLQGFGMILMARILMPSFNVKNENKQERKQMKPNQEQQMKPKSGM